MKKTAVFPLFVYNYVLRQILIFVNRTAKKFWFFAQKRPSNFVKHADFVKSPLHFTRCKTGFLSLRKQGLF